MTDYERYERAALAMQAGVGWEHSNGLHPTEPLQLRFGVNAALVGQAAMVRILTSLKLITQDEFIAVLADEMEAEVKRYQDRIRRHTGLPAELLPEDNEQD